MKMYFLIKEGTPAHQVAISCAHGSLMCYMAFKHFEVMQTWLATSFKKCICTVNEKEYETAKTFGNYEIIRENGVEIGLVFCPREEYPKPFKFYKLYKG